MSGEQQGRCCRLPRSSPVHGNPFSAGHTWVPVSPSAPPARDSGNWGAPGEPALPPALRTPPARDSGRDEAREAVARWLSDQYDASVHVPSGEGWEKGGIEWRDGWLEHADELLALPELAAILTAPRRPPHSSR